MSFPPLPTLRPVKSSAIDAVGYTPLSPKLKLIISGFDGFVFIRFTTGKMYAYLVRSWRYGLLLASDSKGRAYNRLLKGQPSVEIKEEGN